MPTKKEKARTALWIAVHSLRGDTNMSCSAMWNSSLIRHLDASLKTQVVEGACFELLEFFQGLGLVGK